jgi:regulator of protease activity HflC (stomatin/prohibitin superfamily)
MEPQFYFIIGAAVFVFLMAGIKIIRPTHRGLIERLGKYHKFARPGFHWIIPGIDKIYRVNNTEQMVDAQPQEIITNYNLNASVDAQVYFKVTDSEEAVKGSLYNV